MMYLYERLVPSQKDSQTAAAEQPKSITPGRGASSLPAIGDKNNNSNSSSIEKSNVIKTLHFVLDALFSGFPDVYRKIRDQLNEQEVQVYGRRLRPAS